MGKRSDGTFERRAQDAYDTPYEAVLPLIPHLPDPENFFYCEPCAGSGQLIAHLSRHGYRCGDAFDVAPRSEGIRTQDARTVLTEHMCITNPPWSRPILHGIIEHLSVQVPCWFLYDADWAHTRQAAPYLPMLRKIVAVGRIKWIPDSKFTGKDNCCWYLFDANRGVTEFVGRT